MGAVKAKWKRAPRDQRRVAAERSAPKARFTRGHVSGSLPAPLATHNGRVLARPLLVVGALLVMVGLGIALVIAVGGYIRSEQQLREIESRAAYYGRPTQPFATPVPQGGELPVVGTSAPMQATALPNLVSGDAPSSALASALTEPDGADAGDTLLSSYCDQFGVPQSISIFDWNDWSTVNLTNPLVAQFPTRWDAGGDLWRGYDAAKPFDVPDDARERWQLRFTNSDGAERWINVWQSALTVDTLYAYAFQVVTPYADGQGNHFGYHPCRAFTLPPTEMNVLLSSARAYTNSGSRFPALAVPDDTRWTATAIIPLSGSFDLRSIPTVVNNDPIQTLDQTVSAYVIADPNWGVWAQVRLGNSTAWTDTSTVTFEAAS